MGETDKGDRRMNAADRIGMETAVREAEKAAAEGEIPVGAALYRGDTLLWADHNRREQRHDPTAHAEMLCLRGGGEAKGDWRLNDCTLFVTLEPCPMCAGALVMSRLGRCVFGAADPDRGCCGSVYDLPADPALNANTVWEQAEDEELYRSLLAGRFTGRRGRESAEEKGSE